MQISFFLREQEEKRIKSKIIQDENEIANQLDKVGQIFQKYIERHFEQFSKEYREGNINLNNYSAWEDARQVIDPKIINEEDLIYFIIKVWSQSFANIMERKHIRNNSKGIVFSSVMREIRNNWKQLKTNKNNEYLNAPEDLETFISDLDDWTDKYVWKVTEILPFSNEEREKLQLKYKELEEENEKILNENLKKLDELANGSGEKIEFIDFKQESTLDTDKDGTIEDEVAETDIVGEEKTTKEKIIFEGFDFPSLIESGNYFYNMQTLEVFKREGNYWVKLENVLDSLLENYFVENGEEFTILKIYPDEIVLRIVNLENLENEEA